MNMNVFRMPEWYPKLKNDCFPTAFLELDGDELEALNSGLFATAVGYLRSAANSLVSYEAYK